MKNEQLTPAQMLLVRMMNLYPDSMFFDIIESFDDAEFWQNLDPVEDITDEQCIELCRRLASCYQDWNCA